MGTSGKTYAVGNPTAPTLGPPAKPGDRLIDGEHGAKITCSVHGAGPATFSGTIQGLSSPESDRVTLTITKGMINADKTTGTATIAVNTPVIPSLVSNRPDEPNGCTITVVGDNVKAGSLWATAYCPNITDPSNKGNVCSVGPTTNFVLENCDGSP